MTHIAFKLPGGALAFAWAQGTDSLEDINIDAWISDRLRRQWTGWFCYNDSGKSQAHVGRCKGIVLWNATVAAWLVHSVPGWPVTSPLEPLPESEKAYGHSFAWWCGDVGKLQKIEMQIDLMGARVNAGKRLMMYSTPACGTLQRVILDATTDHVAKNRAWGRDLYESLGPCRVHETDTSIWAVGDGWVFFGDIGRMHLATGGGGMVIRDPGLVRALTSKIINQVHFLQTVQ